VDCTLPLPIISKAVLELLVIGDPLEFVMLLPFVSKIIFLWALSLLIVKLPEILSVNLKTCTGNLLLDVPALSFKVPDELTVVNPTLLKKGII